jgi:predicted DNA-binding transcriptional regulator AlpA
MNGASPNETLLRDTDAARMLGCSKATFWRRVSDKTIPKPVKIGGMSRWPLSEILAVIDQAKAKRGLAVFLAVLIFGNSDEFRSAADHPPPMLHSTYLAPDFCKAATVSEARHAIIRADGENQVALSRLDDDGGCLST